MALEKVSIIDRIELEGTGDCFLRIKLMIVENGSTEVSHRVHRHSLPAGSNVAAELARLNSALVAMGEAEISVEEATRAAGLLAADLTFPARKALIRTMRENAFTKGIRRN